MSTINHLPIDFVAVQGFYDGPINGWIRAGGRYLWFDMMDSESEDREIYGIYEVDKSKRISYLLEHRNFRKLVGWHTDYAPGRTHLKRQPCFDASSYPHWKSFKNKEKLPLFHAEDVTWCKRIGKSFDLKNVLMDSAAD